MTMQTTAPILRTSDEIAQRLREIGYDVDKNKRPMAVKVRSDRCGGICHFPQEGIYRVVIEYANDTSIHQISRRDRLYNDCLKESIPVSEIEFFCMDDVNSTKEVFKRLEGEEEE